MSIKVLNSPFWNYPYRTLRLIFKDALVEAQKHRKHYDTLPQSTIINKPNICDRTQAAVFAIKHGCVERERLKEELNW